MRWKSGVLVGAAAVGLAACGGGGDDDNGTGPDNNLASVSVTAASSSINVGQTTALTATGRNAAGTTLPGVTFTYSSGSTAIATVNATTGVVTGVSAGSATITASGVLGSVTRTGTVTITITNPGPPPLAATVDMGQNSFTPANVTIARTGTVTFTNGSGVLHNVTFDAVNGAPPNIPNHSSGSNPRPFNTAGQFPFSCTLHSGMNGRVTVQ